MTIEEYYDLLRGIGYGSESFRDQQARLREVRAATGATAFVAVQNVDMSHPEVGKVATVACGPTCTWREPPGPPGSLVSIDGGPSRYQIRGVLPVSELERGWEPDPEPASTPNPSDDTSG